MPAKWSSRIGIIGGLLLTAWGGTPLAWSQVTPFAPDSVTRKQDAKEIVLEVSSQKLPTPLFRYRLSPLLGELNPGNAAPVYLRLNQETLSESIREMDLKLADWLDLPLASFPQADARKMIENWAGRLRQIEFGTRRRFCDWDYTILEEKDSPFTILLPDAQAMRVWGRLLAVKARVEIAAGQPERAIATLETGIAFGRHVGSGPFYINKLVGIAIVNLMLADVDELIGQPGTPNLYWALTALPRSLVDMREGTENERVSMGRALTGQTLDEFDLARPRSDAEWSALLAEWHARMIRMEKLAGPDTNAATVTNPDLAAYQATMLPQARAYLRDHHLTASSDAEALVVTLMSLYRELADENFKPAYLPYPQAVLQQPDIAEQIKAAKAGPASSFVQLLPATAAVLLAEVRAERKVAVLRVVEALRLHAADHNGELPATLDQLKAVPIPPDPVTGQAFLYRLDNGTAILTASKPIPGPPLSYRITLRK